MRRALPRWAWTLLQLGITLALLAVLWQAADGRAALAALAGAKPLWLALAVAALTAQTLLAALRWQVTAAQLGLHLRPVRAIREYYLAQIVNQALPGGVLGDAGRAYRARAEAGLWASGQSVIFERLAGQCALFATLAVAFAATWAVPGGLDWPAWLAGAVGGCLALGGALALGAALAARRTSALGRVLRRLAHALAARNVLPRQIALSLGTTLCNLAAFAFCARAVGLTLPLPAIAALVPLILLAMLIPLAISGWGLREGTAAALLPLAGASASDALASSVAFGLAFFAATVPGLALLWWAPDEWTRGAGGACPPAPRAAD